MRLESAGEYIEKHTTEQVVDKEKLKSALENLSKPIGKVEYCESGNVRVENQPFLVEFSYSPVSENTARQFLENPREKDVDPKTLREVSTWKLTRTDKDISLTTDDILPRNYKLFFSPITQNWYSYVVTNEEGGKVVLSSDITTPEMIIHLLHEAGHIHENTLEARFSPINELDVSSKVYIDDLAERLLSERNAWAYALKKLRPFLEKGETDGFSIQKDDVLTVMKNLALESYRNSIKNDTSNRAAMGHFDQDYDYLFGDDARFEDEEK